MGEEKDFWSESYKRDQMREEERHREERRAKEMEHVEKEESDSRREAAKRRAPNLDDHRDRSDSAAIGDEKNGIVDSDTDKTLNKRDGKERASRLRDTIVKDDDLASGLPREPIDDRSQSDENRMDAAEKLEWEKLIKVRYDLHDWVPDKVDPTSNGGFGLSKDNGRPVPYRLNGHLDIERKLPWEAEH